jgi:hypothetical protein
MDFKLVSENNLGAVATLFLVILLSHARFFDFLMDTALGRAILILFILGISCINKILGVVAVLFIIIAFNNSDIGYLEGFTAPAKGTKEKVDDSKTQDTTVSKTQDTSVNKTESKGIEGYNVTEREGMMLRGKRSSEVPIYPNARNQDDDVEPSDKSVFTGSYSSV